MSMAIKPVQKSLSLEARKQIAQLKGADPVPFTLKLIQTWVVIIGAIAFAKYSGAVWASVLAILIIPTRQNVLGLLSHDQAHLLGYRHKFGDLLVNFFAAYPLLILTVKGYAQIHLAHHRDFFTDEDPDYHRKSGMDWETPKTKSQLVKIFLCDLFAINTVKFILAKKPKNSQVAFNRQFKIPKWVRLCYYAGLAIVLSLTGMWTTFLLYWVLPLFTVFQVLIRWGALCEHQYNLPNNPTVQESTPVIINTWWEKLLVPNLNFGMHAYHHHHSGVAFSKLPKIHEIYVKEGLHTDYKIYHGYLAYLRSIVR
jgi:fatty acid desaturase